jgi:hypothetical protein
LLQGVAFRQVKIGSRVIARAHREVDPLLFEIDFLAVESDLPAPLEILAAALDHRIVHVRRRVVEGFGGVEILQRVLRAQAEERPPHAGSRVGTRNLRVALRANQRIRVAAGGERQGQDHLARRQPRAALQPGSSQSSVSASHRITRVSATRAACIRPGDLLT